MGLLFIYQIALYFICILVKVWIKIQVIIHHHHPLHVSFPFTFLKLIVYRKVLG